MMNMWQDIEHKLSQLTGKFVVIDFKNKTNRVFIGKREVIKFKSQLFTQYNEAEEYFIQKLKKEAPQYFL